MRPNASRARSTSFRQCASSLMSPETSSALRPASSTQRAGLAGVLILVVVGDKHVGALAGEGDGDGAADTGVPPVMIATRSRRRPLPR